MSYEDAMQRLANALAEGIEIFRLGGITATDSKIKGWRTSLDNTRSSHMPDAVLEGFFKGMFEYRDAQSNRGVNVFNFNIQ